MASTGTKLGAEFTDPALGSVAQSTTSTPVLTTTPIPIAPANSASLPAHAPTFVTPLVQSVRPTQRRAAQACLACRSRKVRCDVTQQYPCSNCRWSQHDCVKSGRRTARHGHDKPRRIDQIHVEKQASSQASTNDLPGTGTLASSRLPTLDVNRQSPNHIVPKDHHDTSSLSQQQSIKASSSVFSLSSQSPLSSASSVKELFSGPGPGSLISMQDTPSQFSDIMNPAHQYDTPLPDFVKPLPTGLDAEDRALIRAKEALVLPNTTVQNALARAYLEHVHPQLPLVNIENWVESITEGNASGSRVSLLFFQAVMFAAAAYVDLATLQQAGFATRKQAREQLYRRAKILYQMDCEPDELIVIQSLLLMTFWYEEADDTKNPWHWLNLAISKAFAQSLHLDPANSRVPMSVTAQRLRRRLWWSCYIRDRLISFGMRGPPRIRDDEYTTSMLDVSDFRSEKPLSQPSERMEAICSYYRDENRRTVLARLCVAQARLCKCLKYGGVASSEDRLDTMGFIPGPQSIAGIDDESFALCHRDLLDWYDTLCIGDMYQPIQSRDIHSDGSANLELNRAVLHMIYHAGVLGLHRSRLSSPTASAGDKELSKTFIQHSAKRISQITSNIEEHGLARFLPLSAICTTISAISVHSLEIQGVFRANVTSAQENYQRCMRIMSSFKDLYSSEDVAKADDHQPQQITMPDPVEPDENTGYALDSCDWNELATWKGLLQMDSGEDLSDPSWAEQPFAFPSALGFPGRAMPEMG